MVIGYTFLQSYHVEIRYASRALVLLLDREIIFVFVCLPFLNILRCAFLPFLDSASFVFLAVPGVAGCVLFCIS